MTPTQRRILDDLRAAGGWVHGTVLRDRVAPGTTLNNVSVQVSRLRRAGIRIEAEIGRYGRGYRLGEPA